MITKFGGINEVFVNQDEGMFVALPMTLDATVLTLESVTAGGKTIVPAGTVVLEGTTVRGILAEDYDITNGPVVGRVVLEGYAWSHRLSANALAAIAALPRIVVLPYKVVVFVAGEQNDTNHTAKVKLLNGLRFAADIAVTDLTISTVVASAVAVSTDGTELTITSVAGGKGSLTAIDLAKIVGADSSSVVKGLPIALDIQGGEVNARYF